MEIELGRVTHYYDHLGVAVLRLTDELKVGDHIQFIGHSTDFIQQVTSMQIDHRGVGSARPGDHVALKVIEPVHEHDVIYRVPDEAFVR